MSLPTIRGIRKLHPDAKISILVKRKLAQLYEFEQSIDEIIIYEDGLAGKFRTIANIRERKFERAYLIQNAFDAALIAFIARIPERVGWDRDYRRFLLTHPVPYNGEDRKMHHIDYFFEIPRRFNPSISAEYPWIKVNLESRLFARDKLKNLKRPILALAPGAKYGDTKKWETSKFREIAFRFSQTYGSVLILGQSGDGLNLNMNNADQTKYGIYDLTGKTSLSELIKILSECDIVLCNDSGIMHLAYALGVPLVAIFGSTSPELTGPPKFSGRVIRADVNCSPCFKDKCSDLKCMKSIDVEIVWNALVETVPTKKAVFFDRDGTLCKDAHYLNRWEDFELFSDITSLQELKEMGYLIIGITNQSGIARGIVKEDFVREVNQLFINRYGFDDFLYCPHSPDNGCFCRKPSPGMPIIARYKHGINFKESFVVGDKEIDIELARMIGAKGVMLGRDALNLREVVELIRKDVNA